MWCSGCTRIRQCNISSPTPDRPSSFPAHEQGLAQLRSCGGGVVFCGGKTTHPSRDPLLPPPSPAPSSRALRLFPWVATTSFFYLPPQQKEHPTRAALVTLATGRYTGSNQGNLLYLKYSAGTVLERIRSRNCGAR